MELDAIKDAFDRVAKKQRLSLSKSQEIIGQVVREIEQAVVKLQSPDGTENTERSVLLDLETKLSEIGPMSQLESSQKELNIGVGKYVKILEKFFNPDISKEYRNMDVDTHIINSVIASHFYRLGLFDIGDCFIEEANEPDAADLKSPFLEMHSILEAMRSRNLETALSWASKHSELLLQNGSNLELKLHQVQFVEILQKGSRNDALSYARAHLAPFASVYKLEIHKLMGCLLWVGRLHQSPYAEFTSLSHWEKIADEFTKQFCSLLGQSYKSPLGVVIAAGVQGLPTLLKLATVLAANKQEWQTMKQLPVPVDVGSEFQFHSVFVCPVLREQGSNENPPMLMLCGHVLSKQSIVKLSKNSTRAFKCPYCPSEVTLAQCRQLHF